MGASGLVQPFTLPGEPSIVSDRYTEAGAAERFARLHGDDVRFDHRRNRWLRWRDHHWKPDADAGVMRLALRFVRVWQRDALDLDYGDARTAAIKFTLRLERRDALMNLLALARSVKPISNDGAAWDVDPFLLGVPNGVVDLRTGELRPGSPADHITMQASMPYDPGATCPRWESFVAEIFANDPGLVTFIQRAIGYSITGETSEQCAFVPYGTGANGKGSLMNTLGRVLGDYAFNMPFSTIEMRDRAAIPNDLAALVNRRFVTASETNDGTRLNESRVKALTGCDPVTARFLHGEFFTFEPVAKFWLAVNHKPIVRDDSHGFWRRIRLIPFQQVFEVNQDLASELQAEGPGILAWCVRGALLWQRDGLQPPDLITAATADYMRDSDPLGEFLDEATERDPAAEVLSSEIFEHYRQWAERHGLSERERLTRTMLGRKLGERFEKDREASTGRVIYRGIARRHGGV